MRPEREGAGRLWGSRGSAEESRERTYSLDDRGEVGKQAVAAWLIEFAVNLQRADVSLLALGLVGVTQ